MRDTHRAILYNYPGRSPQTACKAQPFTGRTLAAQGRMPRRRHQPSRRSRVNLREYSKHRFLPKAYCLRGRRRQATFILAPQGAHLPSGAVLYNSRGRSPENQSGRRSRSRTEPLAPRAAGPAVPSTLEPARASQPSGIPPSADSSSKAHGIKYRTQQKAPVFRLVLFYYSCPCRAPWPPWPCTP